jgi:hypothetical protein
MSSGDQGYKSNQYTTLEVPDALFFNRYEIIHLHNQAGAPIHLHGGEWWEQFIPLPN